MKKLLLLGDSIRMGYQDMVKDLLKDEYEVIYSPDNGRFTTYTLWQANQMFKQYGHFDVVHWNNGYWDINIEPPMKEALTPLDDYCAMLRRIVKFCRENANHIIFANTTPVLEKGSALDVATGCEISYFYDNAWVEMYNNAAKQVMDELNIPVNDLYGLMEKGENYYKSPDKLHLNKEGYELCAKQIAEFVRKIDKN